MRNRHVLASAALAFAAFAIASAAFSCLPIGGKPRLVLRFPGGALSYDQIYEFAESVTVGGETEIAFTIANDGDAELRIDAIELDNAAFACSLSGQGLRLAEGEQRQGSISFAPGAAGTFECRALIRSNADSQPFPFRLRAEAVPAAVLETLSPPEWIQGIWWQTGGTASTHNEYAFSADNLVCTYVSSGVTVSTLDFAAQNQTFFQNGQANSGYFDSTPDSDTYCIESRNGGTVVGSYAFDRQSASSLSLTISGSGGGTFAFEKK